MTLPETLELFDYWNEWPPVHENIRRFVGYEPPTKSESPAESAGVPTEAELRLVADKLNAAAANRQKA